VPFGVEEGIQGAVVQTAFMDTFAPGTRGTRGGGIVRATTPEGQ
jgi:hypothetical protein